MIRTLSQLGASSDARMPQADLTNAVELFGDPANTVEVGDWEEDGDFDDMGDVDGDPDYGDMDGDPDYGDMVGDPDMLAAYRLISGDVDGSGVGGPRMRMGRRTKTGLIAAGAAGAGFLAGRALIRKIRKNRAAKMRVKGRLQRNKLKQTIRNQAVAKKSLGKISRSSNLPFFALDGAKLNAAPIDPQSTFVADQFKVELDRQNSDTPFYQETAQGVLVGPNFVCTAVGVATNRFYTGLIVQFGTNALNASPGTVITITASLPTIDGVLTISSQPFVLTYEKGYDVRFLLFPYRLVSNKALLVLGQYNSAPASNIVVTVAGLPAASTVNLIVPGSLHPWTVGMRTSLI